MRILYAGAITLLMTANAADAQETVRLAIGQGISLEAFVAEIGQKGGIFEKHGLTVDFRYTQGGGETLQAVITGGVDVGIAVGMAGVLSAFSQGAPIKVVGASTTSSANFWFVKADSPIQSIEDAGNATIGFSTVGSGTYNIATLMQRTINPDLELVATGNVPATFTQVMSDQVDIGFATPEFGQKELDKGSIRLVLRDNDLERIKQQSLRTIIANTSFDQETLDNFLTAYQETIDWMYSDDPAPMRYFAEAMKIAEKEATAMRDNFYPKEMLDIFQMKGVDLVMEDAVAGKFIEAPLTQEQLNELIQVREQ